MWRSKVASRACLSIRSGGSKLQLVRNRPPQVPHHQTQTSVESSLPAHFFSTYLIPAKSIPFCQNPRFFSHDLPEPANDDTFEPNHLDSLFSETKEDFDPFNDTQSVFEENSVAVAPGFENEFLAAYENSGDPAMAEGFEPTDDIVEEDEKPEIDVEQLECVLSLLQSSGSSLEGSLESNLDEMNLTLHEEFVVKAIETPLVPGVNLIAFFKWASKKPDFSVTARSLEALVRAISSGLRKKEAYALWDLIEDIGEKENGVLNPEILNELISLLSKLGKGKAAFEVFNMFGEFGCVADADTYYFTIEALCRRSFYDWACSVCDKMLGAEKLPNRQKVGKLICYLCKGSKTKDAHSVYLLAKEKDICPPRALVNHLISSLCRGDETVCLALEMLEELSIEERKYAIKPYSSVIRGLCRIKDEDGAKSLLLKMIDVGPPPGNAVFNSIIQSLTKAGDMEEAKKVMKLMEDRGLKPDVYTYTVIVSGYAKGGEMKEACKVLAEAKRNHSKLSHVIYHTLIRGYCKLEEFDKALKLLSEMKEFGVHPNADEYNKLIQSLCLKALDWETAEKLLEEMNEIGLHLNGITKGLIKAVKEMEEEEGGSEEATAEHNLSSAHCSQ